MSQYGQEQNNPWTNGQQPSDPGQGYGAPQPGYQQPANPAEQQWPPAAPPYTQAPQPTYPPAPQPYPPAATQPYAQPGQGQSQPYPQPGQSYPQPYATPSAPAYGDAGHPKAPSAPRSPILGVISLGVILLATVASLYGGWSLVSEMAKLGLIEYSPTAAQMQRALNGPSSIIGVAGTVGFGAWIAAIVAAATNRGRAMGIMGIIVGILAPIATGILITVLIAGYTS